MAMYSLWCIVCRVIQDFLHIYSGIRLGNNRRQGSEVPVPQMVVYIFTQSQRRFFQS